ncbi:MAG TPA: hypothetical protein DIV86_05055 [Alphaproteobacteria bacterium]|nr:hypothetical protein [Alphaproteobacteria bacterium]
MQSGKITFVEKLKFEKNDAIVLIKFLHKSGMNIFMYLKCSKAKYLELVNAYEKNEEIIFSKYGEIIMFGENEPNQETIEFIQNIGL